MAGTCLTCGDTHQHPPSRAVCAAVPGPPSCPAESALSLFHSDGRWQHCPLHTSLSGAELCPGKPQTSSLQAQKPCAPVGLVGFISPLRSELSEPQMPTAGGTDSAAAWDPLGCSGSSLIPSSLTCSDLPQPPGPGLRTSCVVSPSYRWQMSAEHLWGRATQPLQNKTQKV